MINLKKKYLITGSAGFIGSHLLNYLKNKKIDITLVLRKKDKINKNFVKDLSINKIIYANNIFLKKARWWRKALKDINVVIHLAWYVRHPQYINSSRNLQCYKGTIELAKACIETKVKKFVGIGTCAEYKSSPNPLQRNSELYSDNNYGRFKIKTYKHLKKIFKNRICFLWCRIFYIYGEEQNPAKLFPYLKRLIRLKKKTAKLSGGNQVRDFIHVKDGAKQIAGLLLGRYRGAANICSGKSTTIRNFTKKVLKKSKCKIKMIFDKKRSNFFDPLFVVGIKTFKKKMYEKK